MDKHQVAAALEEIGTLLELKGENPFKSRAFHNAARVVEGIDNLQELFETKKLTTVKGIGEGVAEKITDLFVSGKSHYLQDLQKSLPPGLMEMIRVQGVGPKKAKLLYDRLKIKDIPSLEKAAKDGKIAQLDGFGVKSQENILKGLAFLKEHAQRHHYDKARRAGEEILGVLKKIKGVKRISLGGSLRRNREIIGDVDILVSSADAKSIMDRAVTLPGVQQVLGKGETKSSVLLENGLQVDVRVVQDSQFACALHYFTGSKEHNIRMRQRAIDRGMRLNEYGLYKVSNSSSPIICKEESDLFKALGLAYIPPELREDRGEIEAAEKNRLPKLIEASDIRGAFHVHSTWSDGRAPLEQMIAEAEKLGWEYVGISDHSPAAVYAKGLSIERVAEQKKEVERLRKKFRIRIFWGTECDILKDGTLDYPEKVLAGYDFVIASVHSFFTLAEPEMTKRIIQAIQNPHMTILGHLTGRLLLERESYAVNIEQVLKAAADAGKAVEINAHPRRFDIDWRHLPKASELGVPLSINPDAHRIEDMQYVPYGVGIARKGWVTKDEVINTKPLKAMEAWLRVR